MSRMHALNSATPWYREPWPWLLMSGPAIVIVAGFVTLYLAFSRADPMVVDNYYKEGLAINRMLERDRMASSRDYRAQVLVSTDRSRLRVQLHGNGPLPAQLSLHFIHPTRGGLDREVLLQQTQPGWYEGSVQLAPAVRWDVELGDPQRQWRLTADWYPSDATFALEPRRG
jgi:uncharacterized protein